MKSTQKSIANDASARPEKAMEIQAKGAGLQCLSAFTKPFDSARHCALQTSPPLGAGLLYRISNCFFIHPAAGPPFASTWQ